MNLTVPRGGSSRASCRDFDFRQLAEAELRRIRRAAILAEGEAVAAPSNRTVFDDDDPAVIELHAEVMSERGQALPPSDIGTAVAVTFPPRPRRV